MSFSAVEITIETTPNPATMKFKFNKAFAHIPEEFKSVSEAHHSPLAMKIFGYPWVQNVYIGLDFITITKQDWIQWDFLLQPLTGALSKSIHELNELIDSSPNLTLLRPEDIHPDDSEDVKTIKKVLNNEIRPMVALDGGDIQFLKYEQGILFVKMKGACSGCPSSQATLKNGVEDRLKKIIPSLVSVQSR